MEVETTHENKPLLKGENETSLVFHSAPLSLLPALSSSIIYQKTSWPQKIIYGSCQFSLYIISSIEGFFLLDFLLDVARISAFSAGNVLLFSQIWDGLTDPVVGRLSDLTDSSWGQRRPWIVIGAPFLGIFYWLLWQTWANHWAYYLLMTMLLHTATTLVPYGALTPDMTNNFHDRTVLTSFRFFFGILGSLLGTVLHSFLTGFFKKDVIDENLEIAQETDYRKGYAIAATLFFGFLVIPPLLVGIFIRPLTTDKKIVREKKFLNYFVSFFKGIKLSFSNIQFVLLLLSFFGSWTTTNFVQGNIILWVRYVLKAENHFTALLFALQISIIFWMFVLSILSKKFGKRNVFVCAVLWNCIIQTGIFFIQPGQIAVVYFVAIAAGVGIGAGLLLPWSMLSDVIDYDQFINGARREGDLYALFTLFQKIGLGVSLVISSYALGFAGFEARSDVDSEQPDAVKLILRLFMSFIPAALTFLSLLPMIFYIIDANFHKAILKQIHKREIENSSEKQGEIVTLDHSTEERTSDDE